MLTVALYTPIIISCKYSSSKNVAIEVDFALRYSVSFYLCLTDPSIGSLASHVTDFRPPSPILEPHTWATRNVTGFHQLLKFTKNLRQLDGKRCHKGVHCGLYESVCPN